jgi:hypothetical protein
MSIFPAGGRPRNIAQVLEVRVDPDSAAYRMRAMSDPSIPRAITAIRPINPRSPSSGLSRLSQVTSFNTPSVSVDRESIDCCFTTAPYRALWRWAKRLGRPKAPPVSTAPPKPSLKGKERAQNGQSSSSFSNGAGPVLAPPLPCGVSWGT